MSLQQTYRVRECYSPTPLKKIWLLACLVTILLTIKPSFAHATGDTALFTISVDRAPIQKVFAEIRKQSNYRVIWEEELVKNARPLSITVSQVNLHAILQLAFEDQPFSYRIEEKTIIVIPKLVPISTISKDSLLTGMVVDAITGEALPGTTVSIKETIYSVVTNGEGIFQFTVFPKRSRLVVTHVGYEKVEIIAAKKNIVIRLNIATNKLDEVQIIAYGSTTKRLNTGNVSTVKAETIAEQPVSNPLAALEGRVSGVYITQGTGVAGGGFSVQIRGQNSIAQGNDPLYIVDGVPFSSTTLNPNFIAQTLYNENPLSNINPADIESISVLKDADATAIYGSRGANGVILITTKKGKNGKTTTNFNFYSGTGKITRAMHLLDTKQYIGMREEAFRNDGDLPTADNAPDLITYDTAKYTDWQKAFIGGTALLTDAQATVGGGNENTQFLFGGGYHRETSVFPGNNANNKISGLINLAHQSGDKKFKLNFSSIYVNNDNSIFGQDLTVYGSYLPPNTPDLIDSKGKLSWPAGLYFNPYALVLQKFKDNIYNLISNATLSYQVLPSLNFKTSLGYTQLTSNQVQLDPLSSYNPLFGLSSGDAGYSTSNTRTWIIEPQLDWHKNIGKLQTSVLAGGTFQNDLRQAQTIYGTNFSSDALLENVAAAGSVSVLSSIDLPYRYNAFFGRINFNYSDKLLANFTFRRDGSSRFGPGRQFANFGAIGAGWIFSKEDFFKHNFPVISFGKLRASYGITGNDQIGDYQYLETYSPTSYPYQQTAGLIPTSLFNPNYGWETNKKAEGGLELGFNNDKLFFTGVYYRNRSSNQLVGYPLPLITGGSSVQFNLPAVVENSGFEFELNSTNIKTQAFNWTTSFTISIPSNKLLAYPGLASSSYANTYTLGKSLFTKKLYHSTGVDPLTGIYTLQDVDKDGVISYPNDLQSYKQVAQIYYGGFLNTFKYKGLQLDLFFQFVKQTIQSYLSNSISAPGMFGNQPTDVLKRWQAPGDKTTVEKFSQNYGDAYTAFSNSQYTGDNTIVNGSFIRLKNLSLSYRWLGKAAKEFHFENIKVFIRGQNLLTITNYIGMDPENGTHGYLPPLKVWTAGFQFTF